MRPVIRELAFDGTAVVCWQEPREIIIQAVVFDLHLFPGIDAAAVHAMRTHQLLDAAQKVVVNDPLLGKETPANTLAPISRRPHLPNWEAGGGDGGGRRAVL